MPDADAANWFSPDYATARRRFRAAVGRLGWPLEAHAIGPAGDDLTLDVAVSPGVGPTAVVLSSGVHGVEGPFGSAVQLALLAEWEAAPPAGRVVLPHAVNPFGFARGRRFNEDNIDLNRNFLPPGEVYAGSPPLYAAFAHLLSPAGPPRWPDPFVLQAVGPILRYGQPALKAAIAGGQYDYPRGLFFGGHAPAASHRILDAHWPRWIGGADRVWHLDFHTGLGEWGTHKLLLDPPFTENQLTRARDVFGADVVQVTTRANAGVAYPSRGGFGPWSHTRLPGVDCVYFTAEFGTYRNFTVLTGLRAENQAHHYAPGSAADRRAKARLRELFVPASRGWRRRVVADAVVMCRRALTGT